MHYYNIIPLNQKDLLSLRGKLSRRCLKGLGNSLSLSLLVATSLFVGHDSVSAFETTFSDTNIQVDLTYPNVVTRADKFIISTVLRGKTADNVNVTLSIAPPATLRVSRNDSFYIPELRQDSTLGFTFELEPDVNATEGVHSANLLINYMHKELLGDYSKHMFSKAIEIQLKAQPDIVYSIQAPDSLFVGDKFPIKVTLQNNGVDARDLEVSVIPPGNLAIVGQNIHALSKLGAGEKFDFEFELEVSGAVDRPEEKLLQVKTSYSDSADVRHESTKTFPLLVRPRGFLEIGSAGGVWLGPAFISLIVGVGSIASTAIGVILFVYRIKQKRREGSKIKKKSRYRE